MENQKIKSEDIDFLYILAQQGALWETASISIENLTKITNKKKKAIINHLERSSNFKHIVLIEQNSKILLRITFKGRQLLRKTHYNYHNLFYQDEEDRTFTGMVRSGFGTGRDYVSLDHYYSKFIEIMGKPPFLGTLNLMLIDEDIKDFYKEKEIHRPSVIKGEKTEEREYWRVVSYDSILFIPENESKKIECLILGFVKQEHEHGIIEIVSNLELRKEFDLKNGSIVKIRFLG